MSDPSTALGASLTFAASLGRRRRRGSGWHLSGLRWSQMSGLSVASPALRWSDGPHAWVELESERPATPAAQPGVDRGTRAPVASAAPWVELEPERPAAPAAQPGVDRGTRAPVASAAPRPEAAPAVASRQLAEAPPTPREQEPPFTPPSRTEPRPVGSAGQPPPGPSGLPSALTQALTALSRSASPQPASEVRPEPPPRERTPAESVRPLSPDGLVYAFEANAPTLDAPLDSASRALDASPLPSTTPTAAPRTEQSVPLGPFAPLVSVALPLATREVESAPPGSPDLSRPSPAAPRREAAIAAVDPRPRPGAEPLPFASSAPPSPAPAPSAGLSAADLPPLVREIVRKELAPRGPAPHNLTPAPPRERAPAPLDPDAVLDRANAWERRDRFRAGRLP